MIPDYRICDACGQHIPKEAVCYVTHDKELDAAGSMDTISKAVDLCSKCWATVIGNVSHTDYPFGKKILDAIEDHKKGIV